jgi:TatD DNase family protein
MAWVDSHCHLQLDDRDPGELLGRAHEVDWLVVPGIDLESSRNARAVAQRFPNRVRWTVGLHPHDADRLSDEADALAELAGEGASAVGETGLDYYRDLSNRRAQRESLSYHLELARSTGLPIVVHCRDAFSDVHAMIEQAALGAKVILHCWTGGRRWTKRFMELGVTFSFAGPLAFETGETIRLAADLVPPGRAMVETDTPYLAPPPHRTEANEPAWVALVGAALSEVWGIGLEETARVTSATAREVFGWQG